MSDAPGLFVTLEGVDGSGKSTQAALLLEWLEDDGYEAIQTREPGGTEVGRLIRDIVLHHKGAVDPRAEALLFAADRAHHVQTVVRPALERGAVVVQDRYIDSSVAYQGAGRVLDPGEVRRLSLWATRDLVPDLTVLFDLDPVVARERIVRGRGEADRLESEADGFQERVREAYLAMADAEPGRFLVLDGAADAAILAAAVRERIAPLLGAVTRHD